MEVYSFCSATEMGFPIRTLITRFFCVNNSEGNLAVRKVSLIFERK